VYGTPAWAKKDHAAVRAEVDAALKEYLAQNPDLQGIMQERQEVQKRTLSHLERSPTGKRHRKER
jgi:cell pole-organizing protein PopZ